MAKNQFMSQEIGENEKPGLADDIIGGDRKQGGGSKPPSTSYHGELHGDVHISKADSGGMIVRHSRKIPRAVKKGHAPGQPQSDHASLQMPGDSHDFKEHTDIAKSRDELMQHLTNIGLC